MKNTSLIFLMVLIGVVATFLVGRYLKKAEAKGYPGVPAAEPPWMVLIEELLRGVFTKPEIEKQEEEVEVPYEDYWARRRRLLGY